MISRNEKVLCGWCYHSSTLWEWNDLTYSQCTNREMKRAFLSLTNESVFKHNTKKYYMCPHCHMWSKGSQLKIVETNNSRLASLGGEPVIKKVKDEENQD